MYTSYTSCMREKEEQTARRREPILYTCVLTLIPVLAQLTCVLILTHELGCVHTSLMQQNRTTLLQGSSRYYQLKTGHARTGQYLHWAKVRPDAQCWWCKCPSQTRDHLFKVCPEWKMQCSVPAPPALRGGSVLRPVEELPSQAVPGLEHGENLYGAGKRKMSACGEM